MVLDDDVPFDAIGAMKQLAALSIGTRPFFYPMNKQPVLQQRGLFQGQSFPIAERLGERGFYVPSGLAVTQTQMDDVIAAVRKILS